MGFRYRKSINLGGGFRVNLSKNGIGYSWGVKGYRITKTADGRTRHTASIPGTGISYVEEHRSGTQRSNAAQKVVDPMEEYEDVQCIESSGAEAMRSAEYSELFKRIIMYRAGIIVFALLIFFSASTPVLTTLFAVALAVFYCKGKCRIEYEFDDYEREKWELLSSAWQGVASSKSLQQIVMRAKSKNTRVTAGIENGVETVKMTANYKLPWYIKTNIKPIVFSLQKMKLAIMPDRILVFDKKMGALDYNDVDIELSAVGFLEGGSVPADAEVVKYVWAYSNNDGSADKRYSNNKQYPVMKYGKICITSSSGLNVQFMCSNEAAADKLNDLLSKN